MNNEFKNIVKLCPHCNCIDYILEMDSQYGNVATGNRRFLLCGRVFVENSKDKDRYDRFKYAVSIIATDTTKAMEILEELAKEGYSLACRQLGKQYAPFEKCEFVNKDIEKAKYWFERGIELKDARCANSMGLLYWSGNGIEKDIDKAIFYSELAIDLCTDNEVELLNTIKKNIDVYKNYVVVSSNMAVDKKTKSIKIIWYSAFVFILVLVAGFIVYDLGVFTPSFILAVLALIFIIAGIVYVYCVL